MFHHSLFQVVYSIIAIKTASHWHKNRYVDQYNEIEDPDINLHPYEHQFFDKGFRNTHW